MIMFYAVVYYFLYFFMQLFIFIYKAAMLNYAPYSWGIEFGGFIIFIFYSIYRYKTGFIGNVTETSFYVLFFIILSFMTFYSFFYFCLLQLYVLRIEIIINSIGLVITVVESVFCIIAFLSISAMEKEL